MPKEPSLVEGLEGLLDIRVVHIKVYTPKEGLQLFHLEKRWKPGYLPRYLVGNGSEILTPEFRNLEEALAELVIHIGDFRTRLDEENLWWTKGQGKEERDAALEEEYEQGRLKDQEMEEQS